MPPLIRSVSLRRMEEIQFRRANTSDLPAIVALLADDPIGAQREDLTLPIAQSYLEAFSAIEADPNQILAVATDHAKVIGTFQITLIPGISRKGAWRGQIEGDRIARDYRGAGIGKRAFEWAVEECRVDAPSFN